MNVQLGSILIATDFSAEAKHALAAGTSIARQRGLPVTLLHVVPLAEPWPAGVVVSTAVLSQVHGTPEERQAQAHARLETLAHELASQGVRVTTRVTVSRPAEAIVATANELESGLLVVGARGHTAIGEILLGSVSARVVRLAERPVLVARSSAAEPPRFAKVLVPTDFSPASEAALAIAVELADPAAQIELFYVRHVLGALDRPGQPLERIKLDAELEAACERTAQEWIRRYQRGQQTLRFVQETGSVARRLFRRLEGDDARYDLVALGAHGAHGFRQMILGGIAESTVRHAPCSTLIAYRQP